jgi:carboxymethylenebutenolidase
MGEFTSIMARDGHEFRAYLAASPARPKGAIVVIQEIFGVNPHIRAVTDGYAAEGYTAIAPSLFDRVRPGVELDYTPQSMQEGFGYVKQIPIENVLKDVAACQAVVKNSGRQGIVGFCWGGRVSFIAAAELGFAAAVAYYGGGIKDELNRKPKCPIMFHHGGLDKHITQEDVAKIKAAVPNGIFHDYPNADHGFNCDQRASYNAEAAALARKRTLEFFQRHVVKEPHQG